MGTGRGASRGPDAPALLKTRIAAWVARAGSPGWVGDTFAELHERLATLARTLPPAEWMALRAWLRGTEIASVALEDPYTQRGWDQPRGVPGDAVLLDFIQAHPSCAQAVARASPLGRELHAFLMARPWPVALRERQGILARLAAEAAAAPAGGSVLTLGAAHLREAEALADDALPRRWLALDEDRRAVDEISRQRRRGLEALVGGAEWVGARADILRAFDLVICARPLETLGDTETRRLVAGLFRTVAPGGRLLLCVPAEGAAADAGYLDAFLDWPLRIRGAGWVDALADAIPPGAVARREIFSAGNGALAYALLSKAA